MYATFLVVGWTWFDGDKTLRTGLVWLDGRMAGWTAFTTCRALD